MTVELPEDRSALRSYSDVARLGKKWDSYLALKDHLEVLFDAWQGVHPTPPIVSKENLREFLFDACTDGVKIAEYLGQPLAVDWHLNYVARQHLVHEPKKSGKAFFVKTNAFNNYHAREISHSKDNNGDGVLCTPPFIDSVIQMDDSRSHTKDNVRRGFQDTHLLLADIILEIINSDNNIKQALIRLFRWFEVELKLTITGEGSVNGHRTVTLHVEPELPNRYWVDAIKTGMSIRHKSWFFPGLRMNKAILLSSPNVRTCVAELAVAWHNNDMRKLLFIAPPGSGKEVLIDLFCAAKSVKATMRRDIVAAELRDPGVIEREIKALGPLPDMGDKGATCPVLVVDEIHQAHAEERAALLRVLESDKIKLGQVKLKRTSGKLLPYWPEEVREEVDLKGLVWLFAASEGRNDLLRKREPPDFWTRMDQIIELQHPLDTAPPKYRRKAKDGWEDDERKQVLADYFWRFWAGTKWDQEDKEVEMDDTSRGEANNLKIQIEKNLVKPDAFAIANEFARCVGSPLLDIFSIRYIRGMAKRIKGRAVLHCLQEMTPTNNIIGEVCGLMDSWTTEAFKDLVVTKLAGSESKRG